MRESGGGDVDGVVGSCVKKKSYPIAVLHVLERNCASGFEARLHDRQQRSGFASRSFGQLLHRPQADLPDPGRGRLVQARRVASRVAFVFCFVKIFDKKRERGG